MGDRLGQTCLGERDRDLPASVAGWASLTGSLSLGEASGLIEGNRWSS